MKRRSKRKLKTLIFSLFIIILIASTSFLIIFSKNIISPLLQKMSPSFFAGVGKTNIIRPDASHQQIDSFEKALKKYNIQFESLSYATQSPTLVIKVSKDSYVYLDTTKNASNQVKLLSGILSRLVIEYPQKKLKLIDLRFEKPIVKF